ncbi:thioredoxin family protein [Dysgonomonas macrotermitis]|uniref:Thioredoxin n=1 Tax=Dysgonomonas macrotermitis TaxID=1346286 RepID=A0A1M4ST75_9BACT|nr:thioredoxin family protein [Dysgonomonas macrotermitis]SHE35454.1 hypothetical protein SAMN05444362_101146 [Dysgonomonas macrotermitis]
MKRVFRINSLHCLVALILLFGIMYIVEKVTPRASVESISQTRLMEVDFRMLKDRTHNGISYVLFYEEDSDRCVRMADNLDRFSEEQKDTHFYCVNIAKHRQEKFHLRSQVPYVVIYKDGKPIQEVMGIVPVSNLEIIHKRVNRNN